MKIKVCGMRSPENIKLVQQYKPDFMGFIFYEKSPRYMGNAQLSSPLVISPTIKTVGVFVNSPLSAVREIVKNYNLDFVQLHGNESVDYVKELAASTVKIIKAFQITEDFDWSSLDEYAGHINFYLFDTASKNYGGSGKKFNWNLLNKYKGQIPYFLSGGIALDDIQEIKSINDKRLYGIDINSKFEIEPGLKNGALVKQVINQIRHESNIQS